MGHSSASICLHVAFGLLTIPGRQSCFDNNNNNNNNNNLQAFQLIVVASYLLGHALMC